MPEGIAMPLKTRETQQAEIKVKAKKILEKHR
jgi:hypothetical protein